MARKVESVSSFQPILAGISTLVKTVSDTFDKTISQITSIVATVATGGASAAGGGAAAAGGGAANVTAVSTFVTAAITAAQSLLKMTEVASHFVEALNPSIVEQFGFHLRNLMATIGVALEPIFEVLNEVVPKIADILEPAMTALAPVVELLTSALSELLMFVVNDFVAQVIIWMPLIRSVVEHFKVAVSALRLFQTVVISTVSTLLRMMSVFVSALGKMADQLDQLNRGGGTGRQAALQGATVGPLENLLNQLDAAAFTAVRGGQTQQGFQDGVLGLMNQILNKMGNDVAQGGGNNVPPPAAIASPIVGVAWVAQNLGWRRRPGIRNVQQ